MSMRDYIRGLTLFTPYELKLVGMLIDEYVDRDSPDFRFLGEVRLDDVEMYWYNDSNPDVQGGFHLPSGNALYLNSTAGVNDRLPYSSMASRMMVVFPTVMHELCHYWQSRKYGLAYLLLQLPVVREFTIERQAYRISDAMEAQMERAISLSMGEVALMKRRHKFGLMYFDKAEISAMAREMN